MPRKAEPGKIRAPGRFLGVGLTPVLVLFATACEARERLTFPEAGDGIGPVTMIDQPTGSDTTVDAGAEFFVNGRTMDPDGVDTVYFFVIGGNQNFHPFRPSPPTDTVRFGLPITTIGRSGTTMTVQIYGVDVQGNRGDPSIRQITVR